MYLDFRNLVATAGGDIGASLDRLSCLAEALQLSGLGRAVEGEAKIFREPVCQLVSHFSLGPVLPLVEKTHVPKRQVPGDNLLQCVSRRHLIQRTAKSTGRCRCEAAAHVQGQRRA